MKLYLMRHGIAVSRHDPDCPPDPQRPLTDEGVRRTRRAARGLRALGAAPERILSSPYDRAVQTAQVVAGVLEVPEGQVHRTEALLPGAPPAALLAELRAVEAAAVLCTGHAPHVDRLLAEALGASGERTAMKKAGVACLELDAAGEGPLLLWLATSRMLRRLGGSE